MQSDSQVGWGPTDETGFYSVQIDEQSSQPGVYKVGAFTPGYYNYPTPDHDISITNKGDIYFVGNIEKLWNAPHQYIYVNVWFDWNRDGDWDDVLECPDGSKVREHGVRNEEMYLYESGTETLSFTFKCWHPSETVASDPMWMRVTVSEQYRGGGAGGSGPAVGYEYGETEDYYLQP